VATLIVASTIPYLAAFRVTRRWKQIDVLKRASSDSMDWLARYWPFIVIPAIALWFAYDLVRH
jgi:hypothetical protein